MHGVFRGREFRKLITYQGVTPTVGFAYVGIGPRHILLVRHMANWE